MTWNSHYAFGKMLGALGHVGRYVRRHRRLALIGGVLAIALATTVAALTASKMPACGLAQRGENDEGTVAFPETVIDFGRVEPDGTVLTHSFRCDNRANRPASLRVAAHGCNCLKIECPDIVPPLASAAITVHLETRNRQGQFRTYVQIATSDPKQPQVELILKFHAVPRVSVDPPVLVFPNAVRGRKLRSQLVVHQGVPSVDKKPPPVRVRSTIDAVRCGWTRTKSAGRDAHDLQIEQFATCYDVTVDTNNMTDDQHQRLAGAIVVEADNGRKADTVEVPIEITFRHHSGIAGPRSLVLSVKEMHSTPARVRLYSKAPFRIEKVTPSVPWLVARSLSNETSRSHQLEVSPRQQTGRDEKAPRSANLNVSVAEYPDEPYVLDVLFVP